MTAQQETKFVYISHSPEESQTLGRKLAAFLDGPMLICLYGELGAGKTTFTRGLAEGLGSKEPVSSPSFTLIHEHHGRLPLHHLDLYRLACQDLGEAGIEEALALEGVAVVEWAERLPAALREDALEVVIDFIECDEQARRFTLFSRSLLGGTIINRIKEQLHACACG